MSAPTSASPGAPTSAPLSASASALGAAAPLAPGPSRLARFADLALGKVVTLLLAAAALGLGLATFVVLAGGLSYGRAGGSMLGLVLTNFGVLLLLAAVLAGRLTRVWVERRRGAAASRLHVRLVVLFSVVAAVPTLVVAVFATVFFHYGIQAWFNDRIRTALDDALQASRGYLVEHNDAIRSDALAMANDLSQAGRMLVDDPDAFAQILATQTALRGLTQAVVYEPVTGQPMASAGLMAGLGAPSIPRSVNEQAATGEVVILDSKSETATRAVVALNSTPQLMLMIERPVDPVILDHMHRTEEAVAQYKRLDANRGRLQVAFAMIFALIGLLVLAAASLIGLVLANQIARPVGLLMLAAERVRGGDLAVRVPEGRSDDEVAGLSRAFNRMTGQLSAQRGELMEAYSQIDERRRFTETVLSGVSAGVIGLDAEGRIELPNRAAAELLGIDLIAAVGRRLAELAPEFAPLLADASAERPRTDEIGFGPAARRRTLLVRIGVEARPGRIDGYIVTFDDITELQSAQRKAAWADVARRIAHEIKNPLTPIQLSAERLKRKFAREITSDPETFTQCADTIVRHVGDIGRMVDEFSAFARMPQPVIRPDDVGRVAREALVLQRTARPEIEWRTDIPEEGPRAACDRRLLGQALTNLLQNAADSVSAVPREAPARGTIALSVRHAADAVLIAVTDDGVGLPERDRDRLTEPYVTHKPKGTGLGLAIVKKIMEDHGGSVALDDRTDGRGAVATLSLPTKDIDGA